jgi:hypothetical protein
MAEPLERCNAATQTVPGNSLANFEMNDPITASPAGLDLR